MDHTASQHQSHQEMEAPGGRGTDAHPLSRFPPDRSERRNTHHLGMHLLHQGEVLLPFRPLHQPQEVFLVPSEARCDFGQFAVHRERDTIRYAHQGRPNVPGREQNVKFHLRTADAAAPFRARLRKIQANVHGILHQRRRSGRRRPLSRVTLPPRRRNPIQIQSIHSHAKLQEQDRGEQELLHPKSQLHVSEGNSAVGVFWKNHRWMHPLCHPAWRSFLANVHLENILGHSCGFE